MPFKSESQRKRFYAMARRGEISAETVRRWERHTGDRDLPERVRRGKQERGRRKQRRVGG